MLPLDRTGEPQPDPAHAVELLAERIARLVLHLTALADRCDTAGAPASAASLERASRLRAAIRMGRQELTALSLGTGRYDTYDHDVWRLLAIRAVVAQAQGVLMQRHHLGPDQALASLLTRARERGMTVEVYARSILAENATASVAGHSQSERWQPGER